jgi:hypothetical protein
LFGVDEIGDVEVAVADVADDVVLHARGFRLLRRLHDRLGETRDRHAGVGRHGAAAGLHLQAREVGAVARRPELLALLGRRRPLEPFAAMLARDRLDQLRLLGDAGVAAVELHQQHGRFGERELVVPVHRLHRIAVEQLAARDRNTHLDDLDRRPHCGVDRREGAGRRRHRLRKRIDAQGDLGHHAERPLAADHEPGQVVAGRRLARARPGVDDVALRGDDLRPSTFSRIVP